MSTDDCTTVHHLFTRNADCPPDVLIRVHGHHSFVGLTQGWVEFFCHKSLLVLASGGFKAALEGGWKETNREDLAHAHGSRQPAPTAAITASETQSAASKDQFSGSFEPETTTDSPLKGVITLHDDPPPVVAEFLKLMYPHLRHTMTWENCKVLLTFADKWEVPLLREAGKDFLQKNFKERPLLAMAMAEESLYEDLYEAASRKALITWPINHLADAAELSAGSLTEVD